jgi:hypothetical protein
MKTLSPVKIVEILQNGEFIKCVNGSFLNEIISLTIVNEEFPRIKTIQGRCVLLENLFDCEWVKVERCNSCNGSGWHVPL